MLAAVSLCAAPALARDDALGGWRGRSGAAPSSQRIVDRPEWAVRLVQALGLDEALPEDHDAEDLYGLLCPEGLERTLGAGGELVPSRPPLRVRVEQPRAQAGEPMRMVVAAPATALYALVVRGHGGGRWFVDRRELGFVDPTPLGIDVGARLVALTEGAHELELRRVPGARVDSFELTAFRTLCIEPAGGWGPGGALHFGDKARTLVRAFGLEGRLPREGEPIVREAERFDAVAGEFEKTGRRFGGAASAGSWIEARTQGELSWRFELAKPGLISVLARVHGRAPQIWTVDGRHTMRVQPREEASFGWSEVTTLPLGAGSHELRTRVAAGSGIDVLHLVRRRADEDDYLRLLESLGLREGAAGEPVRVEDAERNLDSQTFRLLTAHFLERVGGGPDRGVGLLADELDRLYGRPLSPLLPAELVR